MILGLSQKRIGLVSLILLLFLTVACGGTRSHPFEDLSDQETLEKLKGEIPVGTARLQALEILNRIKLENFDTTKEARLSKFVKPTVTVVIPKPGLFRSDYKFYVEFIINPETDTVTDYSSYNNRKLF